MYVGNPQGFETEVCLTWGYLGLHVGSLQGFETEVCLTWGYLGQ